MISETTEGGTLCNGINLVNWGDGLYDIVLKIEVLGIIAKFDLLRMGRFNSFDQNPILQPLNVALFKSRSKGQQ